MNKTYPSAIDAWLAVLLLGIPLICFGGGVLQLGTDVTAGVIMIVTGLFVIGLIALLAFPCVYTLSPTSLTIRSGLMCDEIPLSSIRRAELSNSLWSAPALSLRRVRITLTDGSRIISPRNRERFLADLNAATSKIG